MLTLGFIRVLKYNLMSMGLIDLHPKKPILPLILRKQMLHKLLRIKHDPSNPQKSIST